MFAIAFALTRESDVETFVRLASASAVGPDVVGAGADPSGADGSGCDAEAVVGSVAVVPGPVAVVEPREGALGPVVFELDAVIGSLDATVAGPALPPVAEADPPAVVLSGPGRRSGAAETAGPSATAIFPQTLRRAMTAMSLRSFLMS
jgi:hypothetical protein